MPSGDSGSPEDVDDDPALPQSPAVDPPPPIAAISPHLNSDRTMPNGERKHMSMRSRLFVYLTILSVHESISRRCIPRI